jgi:hypothetical protein
MIYQWKTKGLFKVDAQDAGDEVERIAKVNGNVTPKAIVKAAEPENAVLNPCFTWDNEEAADKFRESEARKLVGNLVTVNIISNVTEEPVRAFVNVTTESTGRTRTSYVPIATAVSNVSYRNEMITKALNEATGFRHKYSAIQELTKIFDAIDETVKDQGVEECSKCS